MANQPKKYKKFVATAATATLVASAIVPVASAASFTDVKGEFEPFIDALSNEGIINGYSDGTFKPGNALTRGQVVKMLGRWVEAQGTAIPSDWNTKPRFTDVSVNAKDVELVKYAALVKDAGVFTGSNGNLNAGNKITRQQMAKVLNGAYAAVNGTSLVDLADKIEDKKINDLATAQGEFEGYIQALVDLEISTVNNFRPKENVTRGQFAKFLFNTINVEATVAAAGSVKAINNTTVEVTFEEEVTDVKALDFAIEGLTISNAVVKQTNKKTVVLTTSAQTADVTYTVKVDGATVGTFKGVSAVIPTKVEFVSSSVQGKFGQQVSVQAKVTVAEGASKAGIPVTFSIPGNNNDAVIPTVVGEAVTNAEGVATYTYTRYGKITDTVTAYATGDRSKFAIGYVFWGVDTILSITEVTTGATINNGANKTYKVTYKDPETGKAVANQKFNVGFLENMNVTSDKVANATVNGVKALQLSNGTALEAASITTDSKGEATFTVSGTNAAVTPVVYAENTTTGGEKAKTYKASALQASAAKVTFGAVQADYKIEVTREGGEVAALYAQNGREYKVIVKDKDGKVAKNEIVNIALNENLDRVISTNTQAKFVNADDEVYYPKTATDGMTADQISVKTNDKGEATFVISSDTVNDYATPVAWIDINTSNAKDGTLDEGEPKFVAPISYFQTAYLDGASVKSYDAAGKKSAKFVDAAVATFKAELVNQSDKVIGATIKSVSYTVFNTGSNDIEVATKDGKKEKVSPNRSITVSYPGELSSADLKVNSVDGKTSSVRVVATGVAINPTDSTKDFAFTAKEATATFTAQNEVVSGHIGRVMSVNTSAKTLTFAGKKAISLNDAKFVAENNSALIDLDAFIAELKKYPNGVEVQYSKDSEGNVTFKIVRAFIGTGGPVEFDTFKAGLTAATETVAAVTTTPATATVDTATVFTVYGETIVVEGVTFEYHAGAETTTALKFKDAADLAYKINLNPNVKTTTASASGTVLTLSANQDSTFDYTVKGAKLTSTSGTAGKVQEITFTFDSALNIAKDDLITVNGTTGTVASVTNGTKTVVVKFTTPVLTVGTTITTVTTATGNNTITVYPAPTAPVVIK